MRLPSLLGRSVPFYEVGWLRVRHLSARENFESLSGSEIRLHWRFKRRKLLRVHFDRATIPFVWAQLQTFHTINTSTIIVVICVIPSRVLVVVFLLSLSQSSTVNLHVIDMPALWGGHAMVGRSLNGFIAIVWQWTRFVQLKWKYNKLVIL